MNEKEPINPITMVDGVTDEDSGVEFTREQEERNDEIDNAVYELCKVLTENPDLEWDMSYIGEIADIAASIMVQHGHKVRFPAIVIDDNGNEHIEEYYDE